MSREDHSICPHIRALLPSLNPQIKPEPDSQPFEQVYASIIRSNAAGRVGAKRRRLQAAACETCGAASPAPWVCMGCQKGWCMLDRGCMRDHWEVAGCGISATDPASGEVFCRLCNDVVYSSTLDAIASDVRGELEEAADNSRDQTSTTVKQRAKHRSWLGQVNAPMASCLGIRPLLNLSQTCFLSAILQALIHNPVFQDYFHSGKHVRASCANSPGLAVGRPGQGEDRDKGCMCCEMDRAFEECWSDDRSPFGPVTMLYAMWHASAELEGYGQQDAHSFFLAVLDQIHAHAKGQLTGCNCIAHQTFSGALLSAVKCHGCNATSSTSDPILDIQLDFPPNPPDNLSLEKMLRRFFAKEKISGGKGYSCVHCGEGQSASRRFVVKKLPMVLSFQLKRFAHSAVSSKVDAPVRFPSHLNMRAYHEEQTDLPDSMYDYNLFAVVTHEGKLDNGHYWADVLSNGEWWHCDDDKVTPTTMKDVLSQKAYMLFYIKASLPYASVTKINIPANSGVGGKGVAIKGLGVGGKGGHPIRGMEPS